MSTAHRSESDNCMSGTGGRNKDRRSVVHPNTLYFEHDKLSCPDNLILASVHPLSAGEQQPTARHLTSGATEMRADEGPSSRLAVRLTRLRDVRPTESLSIGSGPVVALSHSFACSHSLLPSFQSAFVLNVRIMYVKLTIISLENNSLFSLFLLLFFFFSFFCR